MTKASLESEATRAGYGVEAEDPFFRAAAKLWVQWKNQPFVSKPHPQASGGAQRFSVYVPPSLIRWGGTL